MRRSAPVPDPIGPETRLALLQRSGGQCELRFTSPCVGVACHAHHRKLRRFGDHRLVNLLWLCSAHHLMAHTDPDCYARGWLVRSFDDPELVEVMP